MNLPPVVSDVSEIFMKTHSPNCQTVIHPTGWYVRTQTAHRQQSQERKAMTMDTTTVIFELPDTDSEGAFLREYMVPAWDRLADNDDFESGWFWRAGNFPHNDLVELSRDEHDLNRSNPGSVYFTINGDSGAVVESEQPHWQEFVDDGLLDGWETESHPEYDSVREKMHDKYGTAGGERVYALRQIAADTTVSVLEEFGRPLPMIGEQTADNPVPVGYWTMCHFLMKPHGYDWEEELDAYAKSIQNRLASLATFTSEQTARRRLDDVIA